MVGVFFWRKEHREDARKLPTLVVSWCRRQCCRPRRSQDTARKNDEVPLLPLQPGQPITTSQAAGLHAKELLKASTAAAHRDRPAGPWLVNIDDVGFHTDGAGAEVILGRGRFSRVCKGTWKGCLVAIKIVLPSVEIKDFERECNVLYDFEEHQNVLTFYGYGRYEQQPDGRGFIVTKLMTGGTLQERLLLNFDAEFQWRDRLSFMLQIANGMAYLHSKCVVHGDLKSANIFLHSEGNHEFCVIGDFGTSRRVEARGLVPISNPFVGLHWAGPADPDPDDTWTMPAATAVDQLPWLSPEVLEARGGYTSAIDVYSFGMLMWAIASGQQPLDGLRHVENDLRTLEAALVKGSRPMITNALLKDHPTCMFWMDLCWQYDPKLRPQFQDVSGILAAALSNLNSA